MNMMNARNYSHSLIHALLLQVTWNTDDTMAINLLVLKRLTSPK